MKKLLLSVFAACIFGAMFAAPVSEQQARESAMQYFNSHSRMKRVPAKSQTELSLSWTAMQADNTPAFYVFNRGKKQGFIIISADDNMPTVLGYADQGSFDENTMPENMRNWLDGYSRSISHVVSLPQQQQQRFVRAGKAAKAKYTPIEPICATTWNQGEPYNMKCPTYGDQRCPTGCVATAAAQVMKVHKHPTHGVGSHSYVWNGSDQTTQTLSADFANTTYLWSSMKNDYSTGSSMNQKNAIATLMYHVGVACEMGYGANASSADPSVMMSALITYFDYDPAIRKILKDYMSYSEFMNYLIADLQEGRPVFFGGHTPNNEGHAFICDGLDADGLLHINWGWGGICDGYFLLSVLNPDEQGIGGSANNDSYTENIQAFTQIRPNENGQPVYTITAENMYIDDRRLARDEMIVFYADTFMNNSIASWAGTEALLVYRNDTLVYTATGYDNLALDPGYFYLSQIPIYGTLESLPAGEYEICPGVTVTSQPDVYVPIHTRNLGICRCPMTITNDSIIISLPESTPEEEPEDPEPQETEKLEYDAETDDFVEDFAEFDTDASHLYESGYAFVRATNDDNAYINLIFLVGTGVNEIPAGTYPIDTAFVAGVIYAGQGLDDEGYIVGSFACYTNAKGELLAPLWYLVSGSVIVNDEGVIYVQAVNSYGRIINCMLGSDEVHEAVDLMHNDDSDAVRKTLRDGQLFIIRNGRTYTVQGILAQ